MNVKWKLGDDYFIRIRPIIDKAKNLTQEQIEQNIVIKLMQIITGRDLPVNSGKKVPVRVESYGAWATAKMTMLDELSEYLNQKMTLKAGEKWGLTTNEEKIKWAKEIQEIAELRQSLQKIQTMLQKDNQ